MDHNNNTFFPPVLVFCFESVTHEFVEGGQFQGFDVVLECGKVGEFSVSLTVSTENISDTATATGNQLSRWCCKHRLLNIASIITAGQDCMALSSQLSFSGASISERFLVDIETDDISEPEEFFEVFISTVEVNDAFGVKQVLTDVDHERIILGQKRARIFIHDSKLRSAIIM